MNFFRLLMIGLAATTALALSYKNTRNCSGFPKIFRFLDRGPMFRLCWRQAMSAYCVHIRKDSPTPFLKGWLRDCQ